MDGMREEILKAQLHGELQRARELESRGKFPEAGAHYAKAAALHRKLGAARPPAEAGKSLEIAGQYEAIGQSMKNPGRHAAGPAGNTEMDTEVYEQAVSSLVVAQKPETTWDDIGGLEEAKRTVREAIVLPFIKDKPPFVRSPKSVLLYGPPGNGKTLIAKASSHVIGATFFEARASVLLSKYFGESSKLVAALFSKARKSQPALVFIDEIDAMAPSRGDNTNEASRRVLSEFLTEMDGFNTRKEDKVLVVAATNKPWELDDALVSRFQRKIYLPMPDSEARKSIIKIHLKGAGFPDSGIEHLAVRTERYSGRDITNVCEEAVISMVRECNPGLTDMEGGQLESYSVRTRTLSRADFDAALEKVKPSVPPDDLERFSRWQKEFGG